MNKRKLLIIGAIAIIALVSLIYGIKHHRNQSRAIQDTVIVEATHVIVGDIPLQAKAVGTLSAAKNVEITPEFAGLVSAVLFQDGTFVKQGTPLIQLDDKVFKSKAESAKAALFYSETNFKRMQLLGKQGVIAKQAIDSALAELKQKQADAEQSQVALDKMKLIAPFDGVLGKSQVSPGNYVTVGQSLVSLTDIQHLRVEYSISEKYLPQLKLGQTVKITTNAYPGKEFVGKVSYISPTINAEDRTISLYADITNEDRSLTAGLFVSATQFLGVNKNAILVPAESLLATIDGQKVFKIVDGKAISAPVKIGERTSASAQIIEGITQNDVIVTAGQEKLKDGMPVEIKSESMKK
jgi:membrane fusion protein (multidrug efflux system)